MLYCVLYTELVYVSDGIDFAFVSNSHFRSCFSCFSLSPYYTMYPFLCAPLFPRII